MVENDSLCQYASICQSYATNNLHPASLPKAGGVFLSTEANSLPVRDVENGMEDSDDRILTAYTADMNTIINAFTNTYDKYNPDDYYMFVVKKSAISTKTGYMPFGKHFGFVIADEATTQDAFVHTAAHELSHGAFSLRHTFSEDARYPLPQATTDNLMDYTDNPANLRLYKYQWDLVDNPQFILTWFQSEEEMAEIISLNTTRLNELKVLFVDKALGITPDGKIIKKIYFSQKGQVAVPSISTTTKYVIAGINIYEDIQSVLRLVNAYQTYDKTTGNYLDKNGKAFPGTVEFEEGPGPVSVYLRQSGDCYYSRKEIVWKYNPNEDVQTELTKLENTDRWWLYPIFNADAGCFTDFTNQVLINDGHSVCFDAAEVEKMKVYLISLFNNNANQPSNIANAVNAVCLSSIKVLGYEDIINAFQKIASQEKLWEHSQLAILRLMSSIKTNDYEKFFNYLESDNSKVLLHLMDQMADKSINPFDGNNYTSFMNGLLQMFRNCPQSYLDRSVSETCDYIFNLEKTTTWDITGYWSDLSYSESNYFGQINGSKVQMFQKIVDYKYTESPKDPNIGGYQVSNSTTEQIGTPLDLLTPIKVYYRPKLDLVKNALEGAGSLDGNYLVPAVFFRYNADKIRNDYIQRGAMIALDVLLIDNPLSLAFKINWLRRVGSLVEVSASVGNIAMNLGEIEPESSLGQALNYYNRHLS
jgi:hypothetical protein